MVAIPNVGSHPEWWPLPHGEDIQKDGQPPWGREAPLAYQIASLSPVTLAVLVPKLDTCHGSSTQPVLGKRSGLIPGHVLACQGPRKGLEEGERKSLEALSPRGREWQETVSRRSLLFLLQRFLSL